mmetsp:Transcript_22529/g.51861  ORF Transcript_22529/g.51861 Transcript_22529/m.51861 type:complete len:147 (+) Transcript_22529:41-481(+)
MSVYSQQHSSPTPTHYAAGSSPSRQFESPSSSSLTHGAPNHHHISAEMAFCQLDPYRDDLAQQRSMQLLNNIIGEQDDAIPSPGRKSAGEKAPKKLAETTRKMPEDKRDDPNDPETIAGMKCQLDVEREIWARKRALFLLEHGPLS